MYDTKAHTINLIMENPEKAHTISLIMENPEKSSYDQSDNGKSRKKLIRSI